MVSSSNSEIEKDLIEIDFTGGLFGAQASTIPTFPFSFEMFGQEDSEDSAETKSPTSVIEIEDAVMNFVEERFGSCEFAIRDIGHSVIIDLGKCEIGRFCPEVGRCRSEQYVSHLQ